MALLTFAQQSDLSDQERVRRIGELIATGVMRYRRQQRITGQVAPKSSPGTVVNPIELFSDHAEKRIAHYLANVSTATPHEIGAALGLSRTTVTRKLARLRKAGLAIVSGRTKGATYKLRTDFARN
jgi:CRP-like cAMP-binding protein